MTECFLASLQIDNYIRQQSSGSHMGNQQCEECTELKSENTAYGEFELCHEDGKQLAIIEKKLENKNGLTEKVFSELDKRTKIRSKHVVRLHRFEVIPSPHEIRVMMYYQYMPRSLRELLEELRIKDEEIGEKQLFGLIYGTEEGLQSLYELGTTHNCVNLDTILCKGGFFKLTDVSATTYLTSYQLVLQGDNQQFLSEKLLNSLSCKMIKPVDASMDDDLFSLAIIVLMIAAKSKPEEFYLWHKTDKVFVGTINLKHIENCLRVLMRNYSSKLVNKVRELLARGRMADNEPEEEGGSLTAQLQDLQEDMSRVLSKVKKGSSNHSGSMTSTHFFNSQYQTPYRYGK